MTFGERLTNLRKESGFSTRKEFANFLGIPETTLRNYEKDEREPGHTFLKTISESFNVSADYLLGLKKDKEKSDFYSLRESEYKIIETYRNLDEYGKETVNIALERETRRADYLRRQESCIKELESKYASSIEFSDESKQKGRIIQYFQRVSAGTGLIINEDGDTEHITIPDVRKYKRVGYAVKVCGNSMEDLYHDGDMLLVEPTCTVDVNEIGIFNVDGQAFVKKRGETELISLNPDCNNIPFTNSTKCMGRVIDKFIAD